MIFEAYLGLGSNLGDRDANIRRGIALLGRGAKHVQVSRLYETAAVGFQGQPPFLNAACRLWTPLDAFRLLARCREVEAEVGRTRTFVNAPRSLDIDILVHGRTVLTSPWLTIPHPRMAERAFVLEPLAEIAPGLEHPVLKLTVSELLTGVQESPTA